MCKLSDDGTAPVERLRKQGIVSHMKKSIVFLIIGLFSGIALSLIVIELRSAKIPMISSNEQTSATHSEIQHADDDFEIPNSSSLNTQSSNQTGRSADLAEDCPGADIENESNALILKLARTRAILPDELAILNHWYSQEDLKQYLKDYALTATTLHRIWAKGEVHFNKNFLAALRELYAARIDADEVSEKVIAAELASLIDYIHRMYFASSPEINMALFLDVMYLVNEKEPAYLPVIQSLVKHHNLLGEYQRAIDYIDTIPMDYENETLIKFLRNSVEKSRSERNAEPGGIPMERRGNHFVVKVTLDDAVVLNLLLDTGASRTALSRKAIYTVRRMSSKFTELGVINRVKTANGIAFVRLFKSEVMEVGGYRLLDPLIYAVNMPDDENVDGLLGMDFLGKYQFRIDHEKALLFLSHK